MKIREKYKIVIFTYLNIIFGTFISASLSYSAGAWVIASYILIHMIGILLIIALLAFKRISKNFTVHERKNIVIFAFALPLIFGVFFGFLMQGIILDGLNFASY